VARLTLPWPVGPGRVTLRLAWRAAWTVGVVGLYRMEAEGKRYLSTQFEDFYARRVLPCFDEPRFKHPWDVTLVVPAGLVAVGNTLPVRETTLADGFRRVELATTRPLPAYLLAFPVGPFDVVEASAPANEIRHRPLPVRGFAPAGRGADLAFALRDANQLLAVQERWFGTPFPYDKLDHLAPPEYGGGAMENAGLITYQTWLLLRREAEASLAEKQDTWNVIAHEMAHQWFGDLVTMPWWTDTWLNESFATWMANETIEAWRPELRARRDRLRATDGVMGQDGLAAARAIRQPIARMEDVAGQFDDLSYSKGEALIAMFAGWIGEGAFRDGVRAYLAEHADGSGDAEQLLAALSRAGGREVGPAFHSFLDQPGVPLVTLRTVCEAGQARLELAQRRWLPLGSRADPARTWQVPVCVRWGAGGADHQACTLLSAPTGRLALGASCPDWVAPNARGSGYYRTAQPPAELSALLERGWPHLTVEERQATAQGLVAALDAGALPVAEALPLIERLARDPEGDVALVPIAAAHALVEQVAAPERREAARRWARGLYAPALSRLGLAPRPGEPVSDTTLRVEAIRLAALTGKDPALRRHLADLGRAWLAPDGPALRPDAVPSDLLDMAPAVAIEDGGPALFELALRRLAAEHDGLTRYRLLFSLARAHQPELVARAQALDAAPGTPTPELLAVVRRQLRFPELRQAGWDGLRRLADQAARRNPEAGHSLPYAASDFCDAGHLAEVRAFFGPRAAQDPGMVKPLAETIEGIELCIAGVEAHRAQLGAALGR
jgi:cytosol alanyl aminopeptidase